ncbi:prolyl oligopeptidase family serine peptidase [Shewanella sp. HL-SH8]|uniref:prolyl oligopeptidase family serine peptidase n=1 Tax=unclassified Shewanella TaxID=196818 RepID=UPI003EBF66C7
MINRLLLTLVLTLSIIKTVFSIPIPADKLFISPAFGQLSFSPDEKYLSTSQYNDEGYQLSLIEIESQNLINILVLPPSQTVTGYQWLDNNHIYLKISHKGFSMEGFMTIKDSQGNIKPRFAILESKGDLISSLNYSGEVLYSFKKYNSNYQQLHKVSIEQLEKNLFSKQTLFDDTKQKVHGYFFDEKKMTLFSLKIDKEAKEINFFYRPFNDYKWQKFFTLSSDSETFIPIQIIDEQTMYVLSNQNSDKVGLYKFDIKNQSLLDLIYEHEKYDLVGGKFDQQSNLHSVSFYENGQLTTNIFDKDASLEQKKFTQAFPNKIVITINSNKDNNQHILFVSASDDSGKYYLFNSDTDKAVLLFDRYPSLQDYQLNKTLEFNIKSKNGVDIESYLTLPNKDTSNGTLLIMPHGGPVGIRDYNHFNPESQFYASRGYAVLRINFRGSQGYGKAFKLSGVGEFGLDIEKDITNTVNYINSRYSFKRRCAIGSSYGGYSSLMLAIQHPDDYQCVVGAYGVYDLPLLFNSSNIKTTDEYRESTAKVVGDNRVELKNTSPLYLANKIKTPLLLIAGKQDPIAEFEHTRRLEYVLEKLGNPPQTLYYDKTKHGHDNYFWERHQSITIAEFLKNTFNFNSYEQLISADKDAKAIVDLAEDYVTLADAWHFDSKIAKNPEKANEYYLKAAEMKHGRANYIMGSLHLEQGEEAESLSWYKQASKYGYAAASYKLGLLYSGNSNESVSKDNIKAFEYFRRADQQGYSSAAKIQMAKYYCVGDTIPRDNTKCVDLLKLNHLKNVLEENKTNEDEELNKQAQRAVIGKIFLETDFSAAERRALQLLLLEEYQVENIKFSINIKDAGLVSSDGLTIVNNQPKLKLSEGDHIALFFNIDADNDEKNLAIMASWQFTSENGDRGELWAGMLYGNADDTWSIKHKVSKYEAPKGTYTLTLRDSSDNIIATKSFIRI